MYKRILLAYDGSESGRKALLDSLDIAQWSNASIHLVAVMPRPELLVMGSMDAGAYVQPDTESAQRPYRAVLEDGLRQLAAGGLDVAGEILVGDSVEEITRQAIKIDADLIVVGHKHLDGWAARWWSGDRSPALIEHAPCSVLVAISR